MTTEPTAAARERDVDVRLQWDVAADHDRRVDADGVALAAIQSLSGGSNRETTALTLRPSE